jgi:hypothetical protein
MRATFFVMTLFIASACGGDDPPPADAAMNNSDAMIDGPGAMTECGSTMCVVATHICVNDINQNESCVALPSGCSAARTCASCAAACTGGTTCFNLSDENTIACH